MVFRDEKEAVKQLSDLLFEASVSLFMATKYIYALSAESFYHCDVKDVFKVILSDIRSSDRLDAFHLDLSDGSCAILNTPEYKTVFQLTVYSFAVRLPALCHAGAGNDRMSDHQISAVYNSVLKEGVSNLDNTIPEKFSDVRASVRKGQPIAPYNAEWFRSYLYGAMPKLADISNRNLFFFGAADVLFPLFYFRLEKEFETCIRSLCSNASV